MPLRWSDGIQFGLSKRCLSSSKGGRFVDSRGARGPFFDESLLALGDDSRRSRGERFLSSSKGASLKDLQRYLGPVGSSVFSGFSSSAGQLWLFGLLLGSTRIEGKGSFGRVTEAFLSNTSSKWTLESLTSSSARFRIISSNSLVCSSVGLLRNARFWISSVFLILIVPLATLAANSVSEKDRQRQTPNTILLWERSRMTHKSQFNVLFVKLYVKCT